MNVPRVQGTLQRPTELPKHITMELFEMAEKLNIEYPINQQIHNVFLDFTNEYVRGFKAIEIEIDNLEKIIEDEISFQEKNDITKSSFAQNDLKSHENKRQTIYKNIDINKSVIDNFVPINNNSKILIIKNINHDLTKNGLISVFVGLIFGIVIVLFQYSIKQN